MGSVRQRKDGRWFIQWIDGAGKQRQKTLKVTVPATASEEEQQRKLKAIAERKGYRLLAELEAKAERQRLGLDVDEEPLGVQAARLLSVSLQPLRSIQPG